jgi:hypothetical protein
MSRSAPARLRPLERWIASGVALGATLLLAAFFRQTAVFKHLDTVFLYQSVDSILSGERPLSLVVASWAEGFRFFTMPAEAVCASALPFVGDKPYNVLANHAYFALYPIAALARVIGTEYAFALLNSAAHLGILFLAYAFLRHRRVPVLASVAFCVLVAAYPGWSLSGLGDYYVDRLAMPLLLLLLYLLQQASDADSESARLPGWPAIAAAAVTAAMCTERAAIMALGTLVFFVLVAPSIRRDRAFRNRLLWVAAALVLYLAWYFGFMFQGVAGGGELARDSVHSLDELRERLLQPGFRPFLCTNLLFLGGLALFGGWRACLLAAGAMLPNVLVRIGGAEYTGWITHYHTMYIPFLVYAASMGYARVAARCDTQHAAALLSVLVVVAAALLARNYDPFTGSWGRPNASPSARWGVLGTAWVYFADPQRSSERVISQLTRELDTVVPRGAAVSAIEGVMPALYSGRRLSMYPIGMDTADYLVVSGTARDGAVLSMTGAVSYLGAPVVAALNACLAARAAHEGFVLVKEVRPIGVIVLRRQHPLRP